MALEMENVYRFTLESRSPAASTWLAYVNGYYGEPAWRPHRQPIRPHIN